jgi:hypothetical protein
VEAAYASAVPTTVRAIRTLCTLLHALEMYSPFVNAACLHIQGASGIDARFSKLAFSSQEWDRVMKFGQIIL